MKASVSLNIVPIRAKDGGVIQDISYGKDLDSTEAITYAVMAICDAFRNGRGLRTPTSVTVTFTQQSV
jgi:hypothetical protein